MVCVRISSVCAPNARRQTEAVSPRDHHVESSYQLDCRGAQQEDVVGRIDLRMRPAVRSFERPAGTRKLLVLAGSMVAHRAAIDEREMTALARVDAHADFRGRGSVVHEIVNEAEMPQSRPDLLDQVAREIAASVDRGPLPKRRTDEGMYSLVSYKQFPPG